MCCGTEVKLGVSCHQCCCYCDGSVWLGRGVSFKVRAVTQLHGPASRPEAALQLRTISPPGLGRHGKAPSHKSGFPGLRRLLPILES